MKLVLQTYKDKNQKLRYSSLSKESKDKLDKCSETTIKRMWKKYYFKYEELKKTLQVLNFNNIILTDEQFKILEDKKTKYYDYYLELWGYWTIKFKMNK